MPLDEQLNALARIYQILDDNPGQKTLACHRGCTACCTRDVTLTTLEGYWIISRLSHSAEKALMDHLARAEGGSGYAPAVTLNAVARRYAEDEDAEIDGHLSDDGSGPGGICPLLVDDLCSIYAHRPLACRMMVSTHDCRTRGYAQIDPVFLSASNVFLQFTEHIDTGGFTGNLADVLPYLSNAGNRSAYEAGTAAPEAGKLIRNHPLTILMVPPEHRQAIAPIIQRLNPAIGDISSSMG